MPARIEDRHGADPNLQVRIGAAPHTVREHVCRGNISPVARFVHASVDKPKRLMQLRAYISARAAAPRC
jgi:hypothetical protein